MTTIEKGSMLRALCPQFLDTRVDMKTLYSRRSRETEIMVNPGDLLMYVDTMIYDRSFQGFDPRTGQGSLSTQLQGFNLFLIEEKLVRSSISSFRNKADAMAHLMRAIYIAYEVIQ